MAQKPDSPRAQPPASGPAHDQQPKGFLTWLARAKGLRRLFPAPVRRLAQRFVPEMAYNRAWWRANQEVLGIEEVSSYPAQIDVNLGIVKEFTGMHRLYVAACRDMGVPYRLVDISGADWMEQVRNAGCDAFLIRPQYFTTGWRLMYDERLKVMAEDLGATLFPSYDEVWLFESKRRMHYWLKVHGIPCPRTWVFYSYEEAMSFAESADLPVVAKADSGWGAENVRIFRTRRDVVRHVNRCFNQGLETKIGGLKNVEWGSAFFQEFIPDAAEWRILRLGKYFFGHQKLKKGDFHSGSGEVGWYDPPRDLLDFAYDLTEKGYFLSMNVDVFETPDGRYLVNELQSLFGAHLPYQMKVNDVPGRYVRDEACGEWKFEEGVFCQNGCYNLRVETVLALLGREHPWRPPPEACQMPPH